jgi:hypothetical protein
MARHRVNIIANTIEVQNVPYCNRGALPAQGTKQNPGVRVWKGIPRCRHVSIDLHWKMGQVTVSPTNRSSAYPLDSVETQGRIHVKDMVSLHELKWFKFTTR